MALIKCPECKKKISDQCTNCPNCGYPLDKICEADENQTTDIANSNEGTTKIKKSFEIKALIKKWWFWVAVGAVIVAIAVTTILLLNRDTKPKFDKDGKPMFVELTNEVYTNAEDYLGYHINIKGKVFQVMSDNGSVKGIQIWIDPDTCEQNMMIYYNTDVEVKQGDYIICSGYIDSVTEYKNAYDAKLYAPLVISSDLKKATYMEVMAPAIETITPENLKQEKYGYSITIDKIEYSEKETRVYTTVINNGKALLYFGDAVIVQDGKQYNSTSNYEAKYEEIPYEVVKGVSCSGVIVFPTMSTNDFELSFDIHSEEDDEKLGQIIVLIGKEKSEIKTAWPIDEVKPVVTPTQTPKPTYPSAVGTYYYTDGSSDYNLCIKSDGTLLHEKQRKYIPDVYIDYTVYTMTGTWSQKENIITYSVWDSDGFAWNNPFESKIYDNGMDFLGNRYTRQ